MLLDSKTKSTDEIEVTPAMIEAGREAMSARWHDFTSVRGFLLWDEVLRETFLAMMAERRQ
jgi:hypothetical protein